MMVKEWDLQSSNPSRRNINESNDNKIGFSVDRSQRFKKHAYGYVEFVVPRRTYVHHHRLCISFSFFHTGNTPKPRQHVMDLVSSLILFQRAIWGWRFRCDRGLGFFWRQGFLQFHQRRGEQGRRTNVGLGAMVALGRRWRKCNGKRREEEEDKTAGEWGEEQTPVGKEEERARAKRTGADARGALKIKMAHIQRGFLRNRL